MFNIFKKRQIDSYQDVLYIKNNLVIDDFDMIKIIMILVNCSNKCSKCSDIIEPHITKKQYDRLCKFNYGKYFDPILATMGKTK